jgi:hypothetical protein
MLVGLVQVAMGSTQIDQQSMPVPLILSCIVRPTSARLRSDPVTMDDIRARLQRPGIGSADYDRRIGFAGFCSPVGEAYDRAFLR